MEALRTRRACRQFTPQPVARHLIEELIAAAVLAPSGMNQQPWGFVVVSDAGRVHELGQDAKNQAVRHFQSNRHLRDHLADPAIEIFHGAPALILICATVQTEFSVQDCCLAAENLMLAARALGLGTCWIGLAGPWSNLAETKARLGAPADWTVVAPIIVGHPQAQPSPTPRNKPATIWA
jgi:nitroreductase